ncbi:MAG: hypothetical protein ACMUIE_02745 [Thermoplasmatota archaeon]
MRKIPIITTAALSLLLIALVLPQGAKGAAVAVDEQSLAYTPETITNTDAVTVTVDIIFVDAEPQENGVVLLWSLCTDYICESANDAVMTEVSNGTWSATIGPFPEESGTGDPYVEVKFHVEVTADPTDGTTDPVEATSGDPIVLEFTATADDDDAGDDDTTDDDSDDDDDDSPLGAEVILGALVIFLAVAIIHRRKKL